MPLTVQSSIDTTFLDTVHFDVSCKFPPGYEILDDIVIFDTGGLRPFVLNDGVLKTQVDKYGKESKITTITEAVENLKK